MTDRETLFAYRLSQAETTLEDARIIHARHGSPRSVVNRAYYATFYGTLALFLKAGTAINTSKHAGIIGTFDREFVLSGKIDKRYSGIFHNLFDDRQEFDYKELSEVSIEDSEAAIKQAEDFISMVKVFLSTSPG
jgi:uncharacterized protein (UPF0332 family)